MKVTEGDCTFSHESHRTRWEEKYSGRMVAQRTQEERKVVWVGTYGRRRDGVTMRKRVGGEKLVLRERKSYQYKKHTILFSWSSKE